MSRDGLKERLRRALADHPALVAAWLFGSVARGTDTPGSDVDVAVLYEEDPPSTLDSAPMRLEGRLEKELRRAVQVVCMNKAPPDLGIRVLRGGELLMERDRSARIRFEVRLRNAFWDLEPTLRRCRRRERSAS